MLHVQKHSPVFPPCISSFSLSLPSPRPTPFMSLSPFPSRERGLLPTPLCKVLRVHLHPDPATRGPVENVRTSFLVLLFESVWALLEVRLSNSRAQTGKACQASGDVPNSREKLPNISTPFVGSHV